MIWLEAYPLLLEALTGLLDTFPDVGHFDDLVGGFSGVLLFQLTFFLFIGVFAQKKEHFSVLKYFF